jgi:hypothetical protein
LFRHGLVLACWLIALGLLLSLIGRTATTAQAQSSGIVVRIARPGEGETIYAGPQTILYSVAVTGRVIVASGHPQGVQIKLEIFDGHELVGTRTGQTGADGTFSIPVTVNPDKSADELLSGSTLDRNGFCLTACHYGTDLSLKPGHLLLRVTATDASGQQAVDQRHVIVDQAGYATIPVQVELEPSAQSVAGIPITAATRIYLVRGRYAKATTDTAGYANVSVEALAEAPTRYVIQVEPTVVNGVLYQSVKPVEVDLPPGATSAPTVRLAITTRNGQIDGQLTQGRVPAGAPLSVRAIRVRDGTSYHATVTAKGQFSFSPVPIDQYLIALDKTALAQQGLSSRDLKIDLLQTISASVEVPITPLEGSTLRGAVRDTAGTPLPFAWLSIDKAAANGKVLPDSGQFLLTGLPSEALSIVATAPGFYSQAQAVTLQSNVTQTLDLALVRRPETRALTWGDGEIIIPSESRVNVEDGRVTLTQGWLWGQSTQSQPLEIRVDSATIAITKGRFALEQLPGQTGWFYLVNGEAMVKQDKTSTPVGPGQMLSLKAGVPSPAVSLDPVVIVTLRAPAPAPFSPVWEPSLTARIRDGLAQMGIGVAQAITLATYLLGVLVVCLVPLIGSIWWLKKRTRSGSTGM